MKILSLFGGIEAGRVALDVLCIKPESYHSSEFDPYPAKVAAHNYPDITHIGSVTEVNGHDYEGIDLLIGGPPCQDLSIAGKRAGLEGSRSSLFWEYVRILNEAKPRFFLVENVASMPKEAKETMTEALFGIEPVLINSALVSAQNRKRLFWVGKRNEDGTYSRVEIPQPEDRGIVLKDILEPIPLTDERWKPLDDKYVGKVKERIKSFALTATYGNAVPQNHIKCDRTVILGQYRRTDLRVHADQENAPTLTANMGTGGNNVPVVIGQYQLPHGTNPGGLRDGDKAQSITANGQYVYNNQIVLLAHRNRGEGKEPECNGTEKANSLTSVQSDSEVLAISNYDLIEEEECKEMAEDFENRHLYPIPESGYYWRKLTVRECARLQTFPDTFSFESVSNSRAYKGIGNSWTVEVIAHIFKQFL